MSLWKPTTATKTALVWKSQREDGWGEDYKNISVGSLINRWNNKKKAGRFHFEVLRVIINSLDFQDDSVSVQSWCPDHLSRQYSTVQYSVQSSIPTFNKVQYSTVQCGGYKSDWSVQSSIPTFHTVQLQPAPPLINVVQTGD